MFERLLVTTDLSEASGNLLKCLVHLQKVGAREATLLHVADIRDVGGLYGTLLNLLKPRLEEFEAVLKGQGFATRVEMPLGKPSREVARFAKEGDYSVIVAGTHGESLVKDVLLGSVVHGILHEATRPVLLIPFDILAETEEERCRAICGDFFEHVLFATDFSDTADQAFLYLKHIVENTKAETTLYHVQDTARIAPHMQDKLEEFNRVDMERLSRLERDLSDAGSRAVHRVLECGSPAKNLAAKANSGTYSLLVMGNQGRGYLAEAFLGRVAHHVVHHADLPVLLVPMAG